MLVEGIEQDGKADHGETVSRPGRTVVCGERLSEDGIKSTKVTGEAQGGDTGVSWGAGQSAKGRGAAVGGERLAVHSHFQFVWDQDENGKGGGGTEDVLYVRQLRVAPWAQQSGHGRRTIQTFEVRVVLIRRVPVNTHVGLFAATALAVLFA